MWKQTVILAIIAFFALFAASEKAYAQQTVPVFDEEFSAGSPTNPAPINPNNWVFQTGNGVNGWGNNEIEYYTSLLQNTYDDGQFLNIVDLNQPNFDGTGFNWTSGKLLSVPSWTYGQFQISAQLTTGDGVWPAIWMLFTNGIYGNLGWPDNGEIDIMEEVGFAPNMPFFTVHNNESGGSGTGSGMVSVPGATTGFHTYALDWAPDHISGLYDGVVVYTFPRNGQDWHGWPFDQPFHMIMNDAIGGNLGGQHGVDPSISGQDFLIDYVRVQKKVSSSFLGSAPTIPANIEAANYDLGGESFAYHSSSNTNQGGSYRNDGIGIAPSGNPQHPFYVGWMNPDEWLNYTISVPTADNYALAFQLASTFSGESFNVQLDDATLGTVSVPNTGGWTTWQAVNFGNVTLSAGTHVIRLLSNSPNWNVNYLTIGTAPAIPPAPTGLTATAGNAQVSLQWSTSAGATSYNIYRATTSGGEGPIPIQRGVTGTTFTDVGLTNNTKYFYEVTAVNSGGESAVSNEASATPFVPATTLFVKTDSATSGSWKGVYGSDGFDVFTDTSANNPTMPGYATVTPSGNSTFQWAAPAANLPTYCLQQAAANSTNRLAGVWYSTTNFSLDMNLTDGSAHQVALYLLDWLSSGRGETVTISDANNGNVLDTRTFTGFGNGSYEVYYISGHVKITFSVTSGKNCVLSAFFFDPKPPPPPAPTGLTATAGNAQAALQWSASTGATSYNIYRATASGAETLLQSGVTATSFTDTGLTNGTTYYYEVTAVSINGESGKSNEANATPLVVIPPAPTGLTATPGNNQVALSWGVSSGATSYNIYRATTSGAETLYQSGIAGSTFTDTGLTNGTTYFYEVTAVNTAGESGRSNEASGTPSAVSSTATYLHQDTTTSGSWKGAYGADGFNIITDPSPNNPTNPSYATITPLSNSTFQWAAPATGLPTSDLQQAVAGSNNRLAGVWYSATSFSMEVNISDGNAHQVALYLLDFGNAGRSETVTVSPLIQPLVVLDTRTFTNFGNGVYEVYKVTGNVIFKFTKATGNNSVLSAYFFDPKPPVPPAPTGLTATQGNGQVFLSWSASAGATSYNVYRGTTSGGEGTTPIQTGVTTTSFTDATVTNGTTYYYIVTAVNANGESNKSNEASATPSANLATVSFVKQDTATSGSWKGVYGADGFNILTDTSANNPTTPAYATVTPSGNSVFQWAAPSANNAAYCLQQAASGSNSRLAGVWYSASSFSLDLNLTDGNVHQISLYLLDWLSAGRAETVTITDATTNAVLDTRTVTGFGNGVYEVYNIAGHVKVTFTKTAGNNSVVSGYFFK